MVTLTILLVLALLTIMIVFGGIALLPILAIVGIILLLIFGSGIVIVFGDVIIAILVIVWIAKKLFK